MNGIRSGSCSKKRCVSISILVDLDANEYKQQKAKAAESSSLAAAAPAVAEDSPQPPPEPPVQNLHPFSHDEGVWGAALSSRAERGHHPLLPAMEKG